MNGRSFGEIADRPRGKQASNHDGGLSCEPNANPVNGRSFGESHCLLE
jgi:hypothetical protein